MNPGRELDALIAEKVMGYRKEEGTYPCGMVWLDASGRHTGWYLTEHGSQGCDPFSPSTDVAAAWEVLEKLRPVFNLVLECVSFEFNCHINRPGDLESKVHARSSTATHAICLAALKAVGST